MFVGFSFVTKGLPLALEVYHNFLLLPSRVPFSLALSVASTTLLIAAGTVARETSSWRVHRFASILF